MEEELKPEGPARVEWRKLNSVTGLDAVRGNFFRLHNHPLTHFSFHVPPHGCDERLHAEGRATVTASAREHQCVAAVNAGFFDSITYQCAGDLTFARVPVHAVEDHSVKFAITSSHQYIVGCVQAPLAARVFTALAAIDVISYVA
jgi:hypothetical protein